MTLRNFANTGAFMVEGLIKLGVDHFFVGPGSRSTPMVSALARNPKATICLGIG